MMNKKINNKKPINKQNTCFELGEMLNTQENVEQNNHIVL